MTTSNIQIRVDSELKEEVGRILENIGLDFPTAFRMYMKKIAAERGLPFQPREELDENGFTEQDRRDLDEAIKEMDDPSKRFGPFETAEELIKSLHENRIHE